MHIAEKSFGRLSDGREATLVTVSHENGVCASFSNYGASIVGVTVPDRRGKLDDVVLGYESAGDYERYGGCMGAVCGRFANRLGGSSFVLNGREYRLTENDPNYTIHGGSGFHTKLWRYEPLEGGAAFSLTSLNGEDGFPGNMEVRVEYTLSDSGELTLNWFAQSDADTVISLTNHAYFNLAGHASGKADMFLTVNADFFNPQNAVHLPTGEIRYVSGTPFDFRSPAPVSKACDAHDEQIRFAGGLDHNFLLNKPERGALSFAGALCDNRTGRRLEVYTTYPALMVYAANFLGEHLGKGGAVYGPRQAVCMETQNVPDSMRHAHFPSPVLKQGEQFSATTKYIFKAEE